MKTKTIPNPACDYENDGTRITAPGKFEGEPIFAPYFWDTALEGFADEDNGTVYKFTCLPASFPNNPFPRELKSWLGRKRTLRMREDDQGFVHCF